MTIFNISEPQNIEEFIEESTNGNTSATSRLVSAETVAKLVKIIIDDGMGLFTSDINNTDISDDNEIIYIGLLQRANTINMRAPGILIQGNTLGTPNSYEESNLMENIINTLGRWLIANFVIRVHNHLVYLTCDAKRRIYNKTYSEVIVVHNNIVDIIYEQLRRIIIHQDTLRNELQENTQLYNNLAYKIPHITTVLNHHIYSSMLIDIDNNASNIVEEVCKHVSAILNIPNIRIGGQELIYGRHAIPEDDDELEHDHPSDSDDDEARNRNNTFFDAIESIPHGLAREMSELIAAQRRQSNGQPRQSNMSRLFNGLLGALMTLHPNDDNADENILETVADESFNEARERAINMSADNEGSEIFIGTKVIPKTKDNQECQLCCGDADYVCGNSKCSYSTCKDCICRIRKTTGKCPNCQGMLIVNPIGK